MQITTPRAGGAGFRIRLAASYSFLAAACLGGVVLLAIAFNLTHARGVELHRWRETTWIVHASLLLAYLLNPSPDRRLRWRSAVRNAAGQQRFLPIAGACMLGVYFVAAATQHLSFNTSSHDFSMIDGALHETLAGRWLFSPLLERSFLSEHWSPILLVLVPLHAVFRSPWLLVIVQPLVLWLAGWVLASLLDSEGHPRWLRNFFVLCFWNHPLMISTLSYLFHMECFLPVLALLAVRWARRGQAVPFAFAALGILAIKEDTGLYLAGLGLWLVVSRRRPVWGVVTCIVSLAWVFAALHLWIPAFQAAPAPYAFADRWRGWGATPAGVVVGFLRHPVDLLRALLHDPLPRLFACSGFVPLLGGSSVILLVAPWVINATSSHVQQASMALYYGAPLLAFGAIATVVGLRGKLVRRVAATRWTTHILAAVWALNVAHFTFPWIPRDRTQVLQTIAAIPPPASIQAMPCFFPVLPYDAPKRILLPSADAEPVADWILLRTQRTTWPWTAVQVEALRNAALQRGYVTVYESATFAILRR